MSDPFVSAVIPAYNCEHTIAKTIEALLAQDCRSDFEIIVVDDGSVDGTAGIVQNFFKVRYIHQDNAGPAAARNRGYKESRGQFVFFTDSDCVAQKDCLQKLLDGFRAPDIAVVSGSYGIANPESLLARCIHQEIVFRHQHLMPVFPKSFGSFNFCVSKGVFAQVGGFNTGYRYASGEDNDLSYKIVKAGFRIYFEKKALVDHYHTSHLGKYLREQYRHGFWRAKMYLDHSNMACADDYTFWKDVLEVPWALACLVCAGVLILNLLFIKYLLILVTISFLFFEIGWGWFITKAISPSFYYGLVMFLRSFARTFGFSTGMLQFIFNKFAKKL